jgi:hypothetical protein
VSTLSILIEIGGHSPLAATAAFTAFIGSITLAVLAYYA